jgi:hypothetical protein
VVPPPAVPLALPVVSALLPISAGFIELVSVPMPVPLIFVIVSVTVESDKPLLSPELLHQMLLMQSLQ